MNAKTLTYAKCTSITDLITNFILALPEQLSLCYKAKGRINLSISLHTLVDCSQSCLFPIKAKRCDIHLRLNS